MDTVTISLAERLLSSLYADWHYVEWGKAGQEGSRWLHKDDDGGYTVGELRNGKRREEQFVQLSSAIEWVLAR